MNTTTEATASRARIRLCLFLTGLVFCSGLALSGYRLGEPAWEASHHGFMLSEYPNNAVNYLRFGYAETRLALVDDYGPQLPEGRFTCRVDHSFVTPFLISLSYRLLGVHPLAARLAMFILAMSTTIVAGLLCWRLTRSPWAGLVCVTICALSPMQTFYGRLTNPHHLAVFFVVLAHYGYFRWFETRRRVYLWLVFGAIAAGTHSDWFAYFAPASLLLHLLLTGRARREWLVTLAMGASPFLLFATHLGWASLGAPHVIDTLWGQFTLRKSNVTELAGHGFSQADLWRTFFVRSVFWLTPPVMALGALWSARLAWVVRKRENWHAPMLVACAVFAVLAHNTLFDNLVMVHETAMLYQLTPFAAMAAAMGAVQIPQSLAHPWNRIASAAVGLAIGIFALQAGQAYLLLHDRAPIYLPHYEVGLRLNESVSERGSYLELSDLTADLAGARVHVLADRPFEAPRSWEEFEPLLSDERHEAAVVANDADLDPRVRDHLLRNHSRSDVFGFSLFDLREQGSGVLLDHGVPPEAPVLEFGPIGFVGCDLQPSVQVERTHFSWLTRYFNRHPQLLATHRTIVSWWCYWTRLATESSGVEALRLASWLQSESTSGVSLRTPSTGLDTLYPTTEWPVGALISENVSLRLPADVPAGTYQLRVSVDGHDGAMPATLDGRLVSETGGVPVGSIRVE